MIQFLLNDLVHCPAEIFVLGVREHQIHGRSGGLFLAVRVVDQNLVQVGIDLIEPAAGGLGLKVQHASIVENVPAANNELDRNASREKCAAMDGVCLRLPATLL